MRLYNFFIFSFLFFCNSIAILSQEIDPSVDDDLDSILNTQQGEQAIKSYTVKLLHYENENNVEKQIKCYIFLSQEKTHMGNYKESLKDIQKMDDLIDKLQTVSMKENYLISSKLRKSYNFIHLGLYSKADVACKEILDLIKGKNSVDSYYTQYAAYDLLRVKSNHLENDKEELFYLTKVKETLTYLTSISDYNYLKNSNLDGFVAFYLNFEKLDSAQYYLNILDENIKTKDSPGRNLYYHTILENISKIMRNLIIMRLRQRKNS